MKFNKKFKVYDIDTEYVNRKLPNGVTVMRFVLLEDVEKASVDIVTKIVKRFQQDSKSRKLEVYLVGHCGPEHDMVTYVCRDYKLALKKFQQIRKVLLRDAKSGLKYAKKNDLHCVDMYFNMVKKLEEEDPNKIDNYPQDTPYIRKMELL